MKVLLPILLVTFVGCGRSLSDKREAWNPQNNPALLGSDYVHHFADLPLQGEISQKPWSDTYWPSSEGGIADRWRDGTADAFKYAVRTEEEVRALSMAEKSKLSPAEKYDIFMGAFDYPLVKSERRRTSPKAESWEGLCHGWAPASLQFAEPHAAILTSRSGIELPFAASDIKALLTFYVGEVSRGGFKDLGERCNIDLSAHPEDRQRPECRDTNAGAFHVVLTNQIALRNTGFVGDVTRGLQVWNQPIFAYAAKVESMQGPSEGAAPGTVQEAVMSVTMTFGNEMSAQWQSAGDHQRTRDAAYRYRVELNSAGDVVGGAWISEERPDFLWTKAKTEFSGYFALLDTIYKKSLLETDIPDPIRE